MILLKIDLGGVFSYPFKWGTKKLYDITRLPNKNNKNKKCMMLLGQKNCFLPPNDMIFLG
jgi:hypothetical protein